LTVDIDDAQFIEKDDGINGQNIAGGIKILILGMDTEGVSNQN
jgi:hypothetical protein